MKWLRTLVLASAAALPVLAPVVNPSPVQAQQPHGHHFVVRYRSGPDQSWQVYGSYQHRHHAHEVCERLRARGYDAHIHETHR